MVCCVEERRTWMTPPPPLMEYLKDERLSSDLNETKKLVKDAAKYIIIGEQLYKRGFSFPLLHCVEGEESQYVVKEVHEGVCDTHKGGQALDNKIARVPKVRGGDHDTPKITTLHHLTLAILQMGGGHLRRIPTSSRTSEVFDNGSRLLHEVTRSRASGHDINGKDQALLLEENNMLVLLVGRDSLRQRDSVRILIDRKFLHSIENKITVHIDRAPTVEAANKVILRGLRRRLEEAKERWAKELSQVLWSYYTMPHSSTNETPFHLTFGIEVVISVEIGEPSPQTALFRLTENEDELRTNLDLL
ncbi:hypothetical protein CR513_14700, partial [Mucuna pruriens]